MSHHDSNLLWLKDVLEHLTLCQQQLEWTRNTDTIRVLTETMLRDLDTCRRLCETLHRQVVRYQAV